jgi:anthraniloyl-CoA monooxygenase
VTLQGRQVGTDSCLLHTVSTPDLIAGPQSATVLVDLPVTTCDTWGPDATGLVRRAGSAKAAGADGVRLVGLSERDALLDRIALAERIRNDAECIVAVQGPAASRTDLVAGLLAGRLDLIDLDGS